MKKAKAKELDTKKLTDTELELMNILWTLGEGTVNDVMEQLPKNRELAYTSVSTILRILEQKQILKTRKEGRGHVYIPVLKKSDFESSTLEHVINNVFAGTPVALIRQLLCSSKIKEQDLDEIKKIIESARMPK